jgi:deazaflavin-dependent oxidoreductase (nitroreductase family)
VCSLKAGLAAAVLVGQPSEAMAKTYRLSLGTRLINMAFRLMTRLGLGASYRHILTVPGRKTGRLYSTPVDLIEVDGHRWLVAGYGPAGWVRNARAAGEVTLSRGRQTDKFKVEEAEVEAPQFQCSGSTSPRSGLRVPTSTPTQTHPTRRLPQNS